MALRWSPAKPSPWRGAATALRTSYGSNTTPRPWRGAMRDLAFGLALAMVVVEAILAVV
ncbi:MAG: hypothetical protein V4653_09580 [Pseudomonadota bacterium]